MIKLTSLIEEIYVEKPGPEDTAPSQEFVKKGFSLGKTTVDPETGAVSSDVTYLPPFEKIRTDIVRYRKEFQPFKYYSNDNIAKSAKDINTLLTKAANLIFALEKMIELEKKQG